jgi:hypothetical protein
LEVLRNINVEAIKLQMLLLRRPLQMPKPMLLQKPLQRKKLQMRRPLQMRLQEKPSKLRTPLPSHLATGTKSLRAVWLEKAYSPLRNELRTPQNDHSRSKLVIP